MFRDSVRILAVQPMEGDDHDLMFPCNNCNIVAHLQFKSGHFYFPTQISQGVLDQSADYRFEMDADDSGYVFSSFNSTTMGRVFNTPNESYGLVLKDSPPLLPDSIRMKIILAK